MTPMATLKAVVRNGRLTVDEPTDLPEGTVVDLYLDADELDDEELARLDAALDRSAAQVAAGQLRPIGELLDELRASR